MATPIDLDAGLPLEGPIVQMQGRVWRFKPRIGARKLAEVQDGADSATNVQVIDAIQGFIRDALEPSEHQAWHQVVADDALDSHQTIELYRALVEAYGNRPTNASSPSSAGPSTNGTGSTETSPSPAAPTSAAGSTPPYGAF